MKFYQKSWFIWLMLIFLPPVGIILLWTQKKYNPVPRVILSIVFLIFFIVMLPKGEPSEQQVISNTPDITATPQKEVFTTAQNQKTEESKTTGSTQETPQQKPEYEVEISAKDLSEAFHENEIRANQNYKKKIAKITGTIESVGESFGQTYIVLSNEDETFSNFVGIQCFFKDKNEINKIAQKNKGDTVTVIGEIDGMSLNVSVRNCKFAE